MNPAESLLEAAGQAAEVLDDAAVLIPRALLALVVGGVLAWRPWRAWMGLSPVKRDMAQAQALLCVAGCVMVAVIGDNVARAFGLVGIGGLIRFRSALKDPRDGAIFFLLIGLGMAAGMGAFALVVSGGLLLAVMLAAVDRFWPGSDKPPQMRVLLRCEKPREVEHLLRPAFARAQVTVKESDADDLEQLLRFVVLEPSPGAVSGVLLETGAPVRHVRCEPAKEKDPDA